MQGKIIIWAQSDFDLWRIIALAIQALKILICLLQQGFKLTF